MRSSRERIKKNQEMQSIRTAQRAPKVSLFPIIEASTPHQQATSNHPAHAPHSSFSPH